MMIRKCSRLGFFVAAWSLTAPMSSAYADPFNNVKIITEAHNDRDIKVRAGEEFSIVLPWQASGHTWARLATEEETFKSIGAPTLIARPDDALGNVAGGAQDLVFHYKAISPGRNDLTFIHYRPIGKFVVSRTAKFRVVVTQ